MSLSSHALLDLLMQALVSPEPKACTRAWSLNPKSLHSGACTLFKMLKACGGSTDGLLLGQQGAFCDVEIEVWLTQLLRCHFSS